MLATSVRVRPWSALCRLSSEGRRTMIASPSTATARSAWTSRLISPLGPFTVIRRPSSCAATPLGMGTGFLPMRDMGGLLPDQREQLAAHPGGARFTVGHEPLRRRQDRHPEAVLDARDLARFDVAAQARRGHTLERADHRGVVVILEVEPQQPVTPVVQHLEILDVVVVGSSRAISTFSFDTGMSTRRCPAWQALRTRVSISATGSITLISRSVLYQLALRTPGISPRSASSRKQMRHSRNLRSVPRLRPQRWHR